MKQSQILLDLSDQHNAMRDRRDFTVALVFLGLVLSLCGISVASTGFCSREWETNIHYSCKRAGVSCADGCICKDVRGLINWSDCFCLDIEVTKGGERSCGSDGRWRVLKTSGSMAAKGSASFQFHFSPSNALELFDVADIAGDGQVVKSQILSNPGDVEGTFALTFGSGPPEDIPVFFT